MTAKILVLGGAGYIGSVMVPLLLARDYHVTVVDSFLYTRAGANPLATMSSCPWFDIFRADVRDWRQIKDHVQAADIIIPMASLVGAPLCDLNPVDAELVNLRHPLELFANLGHGQVCIMPTTESSYGSNADVCTEETPLNPLSTYAKHKVAVEQALLERENSISLRLATVYGMSPRMRLDLLVNDFAWRAYKDGSILLFEHNFRRTVLHVRDAARAFLHAVETLDFGVYNVGNDNVTKLQLCDMLRKKLPKFFFTLMPVGKDPDQRDYIVSSDKLKATGYRYEVGLSDGIDELLKGYKALSNSIHGNV